MTIKNWDVNPKWKELPKPEIGDKVMLSFKDEFEYSVKAIVTEVNNDEIIGNVVALFEGNAGVTSGHPLDSFNGKTISFKRRNIQKIFKKPLA